jgi:hypothetical protein
MRERLAERVRQLPLLGSVFDLRIQAAQLEMQGADIHSHHAARLPAHGIMFARTSRYRPSFIDTPRHRNRRSRGRTDMNWHWGGRYGIEAANF